ncbi:hypothetical protein BH11BAC6_BH11BAC6_14860 [soil metagenome]
MKRPLLAGVYIFCCYLTVCAQKPTELQDGKNVETYSLVKSSFHNIVFQDGFIVKSKSVNKESAALNEGFNNILATLSQNDTYIKNSVSNPKSHNKPDTYKGIYWYTGCNDNNGTHTNNSVLNYWFYLLLNGGSGTNDKGVAYNVQGIGLLKSQAIAAHTFNTYSVSISNYEDACYYAVKSAETLYGINSLEVLQTMKAWNAVGVEPANTTGYCFEPTINN